MRIALSLATASVVLIGSGADAFASGTCTYDPATKVVTASMDDEMGVSLVRSGSAIVFFTSSDTTHHSCGAATVTNTKRIEVTGTGWSSDVSNSTVIAVDESAGRFAPGAGKEATSVREIEVRISVVPGENILPPVTQLPLILSYIGTARADLEIAGANGLDLNGDRDLDVTTHAHPFDEVWLSGLVGNDRLSGGGNAATGAPVQVPMRLHGGRDDDRLRGGAANDTLDESAGVGGDGHDVLMGDDGDDTLRGGAQNDRLRGGPGEDELFGNGGYDAFYARDGWADSVHGGSGVDDASVDPFDVVDGVENFF